MFAKLAQSSRLHQSAQRRHLQFGIAENECLFDIFISRPQIYRFVSLIAVLSSFNGKVST